MKKTKIGDVEFNTLASATSICCWPHARIDQDRMLLKQAWMNNMRQVRLSLGNLSPTIRMTISRKTAAIATRDAASVMGGKSTSAILAK